MDLSGWQHLWRHTVDNNNNVIDQICIVSLVNSGLLLLAGISYRLSEGTICFLNKGVYISKYCKLVHDIHLVIYLEKTFSIWAAESNAVFVNKVQKWENLSENETLWLANKQQKCIRTNQVLQPELASESLCSNWLCWHFFCYNSSLRAKF